MSIRQIRKRDGRIVPFDRSHIKLAIFKAAKSVGGRDSKLASRLANEVVKVANAKFSGKIPSVEELQDIVEKVLIERGHAATAKAYILYRKERTEFRELKRKLIGKDFKCPLSLNAMVVLAERYLLRDCSGRVCESPDEMFRRVAHNIAQAEKQYGKTEKQAAHIEADFFELMLSLDFLPNSPTLMNAGAPLQQLSACFVLPVDDSIESIFNAIKWAAVIQKSGGGTGFNFSHLRPAGSPVKTTSGVASGPVSFMHVFDSATNAVLQGGKRRGANMGMLRIDHPDIISFITAKKDMDSLQNFNISVLVTREFLNALRENGDYALVNPLTEASFLDFARWRKARKQSFRFHRKKDPWEKEMYRSKLNAREVFKMIASEAWRNGDPGIVFLDRINAPRTNPTPALGRIESTNPCAEAPLLPFESCNLGSLNVANFCKHGKIDYKRLKKAIHLSVRFLDDVIDMCQYPLPQISSITRANRKIGLGIMGFADLLFQIGVPYDSKQGIHVAKQLMSFIQREADRASESLAREKGCFPNWQESIYGAGVKKRKMRNATRTTIAPTGTLSMIADVSSGIEPVFSLAYTKQVLGGRELQYVNKYFRSALACVGLYSDELVLKIGAPGSAKAVPDIPENIRKVFATAFDVEPYWHVAMQAVFQKYTDNAVSKTVNLPSNATISDVENAYLLAYRLGCKGITVYRDKSRGMQPLTTCPIC
ncbi:TPA: adenosylcobalamin-dependent ribonucleoside-diphosphate reductase [Candidatus Micrarchaeota archaeon]|nr:adenosylcobalamin-dependent ribonucleoside-diphosphate reductase [Candidatus Micrarchaeota archaeon]